jgi:hypothetical protein
VGFGRLPRTPPASAPTIRQPGHHCRRRCWNRPRCRPMRRRREYRRRSSPCRWSRCGSTRPRPCAGLTCAWRVL